MWSKDDEPADGPELGLDPLDDRRQVRSCDEDLGLGVFDDLEHFGRGEPPVHVHRDGAEEGDAEGELEESHAVAGEDGDAIVRADAVRG